MRGTGGLGVPEALGVGDSERAAATAEYSAETLDSRRGGATSARVWRPRREARATVWAAEEAASLFLRQAVFPTPSLRVQLVLQY